METITIKCYNNTPEPYLQDLICMDHGLQIIKKCCYNILIKDFNLPINLKKLVNNLLNINNCIMASLKSIQERVLTIQVFWTNLMILKGQLETC